MVAPSTERWNRWNERQARNAFIVPLELDHTLVEVMLDRGLVSDRDSRNREKLGRAIRLFISNALDASTRESGET